MSIIGKITRPFPTRVENKSYVLEYDVAVVKHMFVPKNLQTLMGECILIMYVLPKLIRKIGTLFSEVDCFISCRNNSQSRNNNKWVYWGIYIFFPTFWPSDNLTSSSIIDTCIYILRKKYSTDLSEYIKSWSLSLKHLTFLPFTQIFSTLK